MGKRPTVSVVMPAYNVELYVAEAIDSILNQTFDDFELLIIDDGSQDETVNIISSYADPRIVLIKNEENRGVIFSLNRGYELAKGAYIARMDSDDITYPDRFEKQLAFLVENPTVGILGGAHRLMGSTAETHYPKYLEEIKLQLLKKPAFSHPTIMIRREVIINHNLYYDENYKYAEDYNWAVDAVINGVEIANLEDVLLDYRLHDTQVTSTRRKEQLAIAEKIQEKYFNHLFSGDLTENEAKEYTSFSKAESMSFRENILHLDKIYRANIQFSEKRFTVVVRNVIYLNAASQGNPKASDVLFALKKGVSLKLLLTVINIYVKSK